jgi:hypothetical protein
MLPGKRLIFFLRLLNPSPKAFCTLFARREVPFRLVELGELYRIACSSKDSRVEVISSIERWGTVVVALDVRRTRFQSLSGTLSSGEETKVLALEAADGVVTKVPGPRSGEFRSLLALGKGGFG